MSNLHGTLVKILGICILFSTSPVYSQVSKSDSILQKLEKLTTDTAKATYLVQASTAAQQQELQAALKFAIQAVGFAEKSGSIRHQKAAFKQATVACFYAGFVGEAAKYASAYANLVQRAGTNYEKAIACNDLAAIKHASLNHVYNAEVEKNYLKALDLFDQDSKERNLPPHTLEKLSIYSNLGMLYSIKEDFKSTEKYLKLGLEASEKLQGSALVRMRILVNYAELLIDENRKEELILIQNENFALSQKMQNKQIESIVYMLWGIWYDQQGDRMRALMYFRDAYEWAVSQQELNMVKDVSQRMSTIFEVLGKPDSTLHYMKIVKEIEEKQKLSDARVQVATTELQQQMELWKKEVADDAKSQKRGFMIAGGSILVLALVGYFLFYRARNKYRTYRLQMMEQELEKQQLELEKELLEGQLESKDKQLTTEVIYKLRKNELIDDVVKKLIVQSREIDQDSRRVILKVAKDLREANREEVWEEFELRFRQVHEEFYRKIHEQCPSLTVNERRLAAFLRLNLSTKEIATLTGQSIRAVEIARTRLRKKLNLTNSETGLVEYLASL